MITVTEWATEILTRSRAAATRFNPDALIRLATVDGRVQAVLTDETEATDTELGVGDVTVWVETGLEGLLDCTEPHDQLVLRPAGSQPNPRGH